MPSQLEALGPACRYSVVVPMHNEEAYVEPLYVELVAVMDALGEPYELIFVDDGSTDRTLDLLSEVAENDPRVRAVRLKKNFGQTAALTTGFDQASGDIIIAMDADLRSNPAEIPILLDKLAEGYDLVSGWRCDRRHEGILRTWPSAVANRILARLSGVHLRDFGGTFKAYRREIVRDLHLYGEQHRFIPVFASWLGASIAEVPVSDSPRKFGKSHYGLGRTVRVFFDLITIKFLRHYRMRPLHLFGPAGLASISAGTGLLIYSLVQRLLQRSAVSSWHDWTIIAGVLLLLAGLQLTVTGLVAELLVRNYFVSQQERIYRIERVVRAPRFFRAAR